MRKNKKDKNFRIHFRLPYALIGIGIMLMGIILVKNRSVK